MPNGNELTQFDYLYDALTNKFPGLTGKADGTTIFQFATAPIAADWVSSEDEKAYDLAIKGSADLTGFYTPGESIDIAYRDLLSSIEPPNAKGNKQFLAARKLAEDASAVQQVKSSEANAAYRAWAASHQNQNGTPEQNLTEWMKDPVGGLSWGQQLALIEREVTEKQEAMTNITETLNAPLAAAQKAAQEDKMQIPAGLVSRVSIGGTLAQDLKRWDENNDPEFDVVLDGSRTIKYPWKTLYKTEVHQDCWGASASVNVNTSRIITDEHYRLEVLATGVQAYPVARGRWFDPDYVNPDVKLIEGGTFSSDTFFGASGSLHLIPDLLFVMYKPTYKLTVSDTVYEQEFEANANADIEWIDLFGTRFKFDGLASLQPKKEADSTTTITFASPGEVVPQIMGVVSTVHWDGKSAGATRGA